MKQSSIHSSFRYLICLGLSVSFLLPVQAQEEESDPPLPYAYRNTIEVSLGNARNLNKYGKLIDKGISQAGAEEAGIDMTFRYTRFIDRHWGFYTHAEFTSFLTTETEVEPALKAHYLKQGRTLERLNYYYWDTDGSYSDYGTFLAGTVYRYDIGRWSFRGRIGAGLRLLNTEGFSIICTPSDASNPNTTEEASSTFSSNNTQVAKQEELYFYTGKSDGSDGNHRAFAYNGSLQCCFTPRRHLFFQAEISLTGTIGHLFQFSEIRERNTYCGPYLAVDPISPTGYAYVQGGESVDVQSQLISRQRQRISMGNFLNIRFGVGWNIGRNHNAK